MKLQTRPVFVLSAPRSGSTLFRLILNAHPALAFPPPAWLYEFLRGFVYSYGDLSDERNLMALAEDFLNAPTIRKGAFGVEPKSLVDEARESSFAGLYEAIHRVWAARQGKTRWGQKSPRNAFWMREILEDFPNAQFIHIVRDGRDVTLDLSDSKNFRPDNLYAGAHLWRRYVGTIEAARDRLQLGPDTLLEIRYEDLCADPESVCRKICDFLGEDWSDEMLAHHRSDDAQSWASDETHAKSGRPITTEYCGMWRKRLIGRDLDMVTTVQRSLLERFGYETTGSDWSPDALDAAQWFENEIPTSVANHAYKNDLQLKRRKRADDGIYDPAARETQVWGTA